MTPNLQAIAAIWSFKRELKYVLFAFLITLLIPVLAVILVANVGLSVVSDKLVTLNPQTNTVEIHDPRTGEVIKDLKITAVWPVSGVVTLEFGQSNFPYQVLHTGIDIASPQGKIGDPLTPFMEGTVIFAGGKPHWSGKTRHNRSWRQYHLFLWPYERNLCNKGTKSETW